MPATSASRSALFSGRFTYISTVIKTGSPESITPSQGRFALPDSHSTIMAAGITELMRKYKVIYGEIK
jgi:hypothetical protein